MGSTGTNARRHGKLPRRRARGHRARAAGKGHPQAPLRHRRIRRRTPPGMPLRQRDRRGDRHQGQGGPRAQGALQITALWPATWPNRDKLWRRGTDSAPQRHFSLRLGGASGKKLVRRGPDWIEWSIEWSTRIGRFRLTLMHVPTHVHTAARAPASGAYGERCGTARCTVDKLHRLPQVNPITTRNAPSQRALPASAAQSVRSRAILKGLSARTKWRPPLSNLKFSPAWMTCSWPS